MENVHKLEVSHSEVMFYLEEMIEMDLVDEIEERLYTDIKWKKYSKKDYTYVQNRVREWQEEQF